MSSAHEENEEGDSEEQEQIMLDSAELPISAEMEEETPMAEFEEEADC